MDQVFNLIFVNSAENENGNGDARLAEMNALLEARNGNHINAEFLCSQCHPNKAMAISIRLQGKTEFFRPNERANRLDVLCKSREVNFNPGWMVHGCRISKD